eukprot:TRINITY_DN6243_c0_g1_i1.p1 TRINITY_DN6243_c0_g1~~TRINITY_DN6243_c0_g1_i1.p1  ORF type:complete len:370 (+),score=61.27 TRINITY_DN6243_c0_g1_i1:87-1196(+)
MASLVVAASTIVKATGSGLATIGRVSTGTTLGRRHLHGQTFGFVGLGKIGSGMAGNLVKAGAKVVAYDRDPAAVERAVNDGAEPGTSATDVAQRAHFVFTAVPDDRVLLELSDELLPALAERPDGKFNDASGHLHGHFRPVHVSCSTVAPRTTRALGCTHEKSGVGFVSAPVFARPDGMRRGEATIPISGPAWAKALVVPALEKTASGVHDYGQDPGAASVVKLGGNFLIAAAIESLAEASALAESHGVDREQFVSLMSSTIFDCLIYRGYGHRVATRDHFPHLDAHFALDLGTKDVALIHAAAADAKCPMPVASLLRDRFVASQNAGRGSLDWSALGLRASEEAGTDVSEALKKLLPSRGSSGGSDSC